MGAPHVPENWEEYWGEVQDDARYMQWAQVEETLAPLEEEAPYEEMQQVIEALVHLEEPEEEAPDEEAPGVAARPENMD